MCDSTKRRPPGMHLARAPRNHGIREPNGPDHNSRPPELSVPNLRKRQTQSASTRFESAAAGNRALASIRSAPGTPAQTGGGSNRLLGRALAPLGSGVYARTPEGHTAPRRLAGHVRLGAPIVRLRALEISRPGGLRS